MMGRPPLAPQPLGDWRRQPGMLGLRLTVNTDEARAWLADPAAWVSGEAERAQLPVMVSPPGLLPQLGSVARYHPGLALVVDHLGLLRAKDNAAFDDLPKLLRLARLANVAVKASALPAYSFWGTDLPRLPCSYLQAIALFTEELPFLSPSDREWVMGRGLCEWLGWPT
jgi:L-fuconolactonase